MNTMTEPTTEEKIQLLVKSVLEAVDARLDTVRHELATFSNDVEQRHHHLLETMAALDARITELAAGPTSPPDAAATAQLAADLEALRLRVESLASRPAPAPTAALTDAPVVAPAAEVAHDTPSPADPAVVTGSHQITREELDEISRPIVTHITTQVPVVPDPTGHHEPMEHMPLRVPPMVTPHFGTPHAAQEDAEHGDDSQHGDTSQHGGDEIDLDQLASLLNARLGSLSLPTRHD